MKPDLFEAPDYYNLDDLLTDEHKLIRDSAREWVKKSVSPIIEEYAQKAEFPNHLIKELADIGILAASHETHPRLFRLNLGRLGPI